MSYPHRISIYRDVSAEGVQELDERLKFPWVPARLEPVAGRELYRGEKLQPSIEWIVEIRPQPIDRTDQVKVNRCNELLEGKLLNVEYIRTVPDTAGRRMRQFLFCREAVIDG